MPPLAIVNKRCILPIVFCTAATLAWWNTSPLTYFSSNSGLEQLPYSSNQNIVRGLNNTKKYDVFQKSEINSRSNDEYINLLGRTANSDRAGVDSTANQVLSPQSELSDSQIITRKTVSILRLNEMTSKTLKKNEVKILSRKRIVIVLAYMRSGSTLTASLLQEYQNTFYVYEPLKNIYPHFQLKTVRSLRYFNGTSKQYDKDKASEVYMDEIKSWLTCKIEDISMPSLVANYHKKTTKYMKIFNVCYKYAKKRNSVDDMNNCLKQAVSSCQRAPLIVLKILRMTMADIVELLPYFPNMKILHLVRDPRGIFNSRSNMKRNNKHTKSNVSMHCDTIQYNINMTNSIQKTHPDRVKIVLYEDIAERPLHASKAISEFSGIQFTDHMRDYITSHTEAKRNSCKFCTSRKDSAKTASKWRTNLNPKYASQIYSGCASSNQYLGYLALTSPTDQHNTSKPSRRPTNSHQNKVILKV